jgi:tetratricopeptide (TPR) repeat protein
MLAHTQTRTALVVSLAMLTAALVFSRPAFAGDNSASAATPEDCQSVAIPHEIVFQGKKLMENPDIDAPELQRANALIDAQCLEQADALQGAYATAHPDDYRVSFIRARAYWHLGMRSMAESILNSQIRVQPNFPSALRLLATMKLEDQDYLGAQALLDQVEKQQPTDLWAFMYRLRIEAALTPSPSTLRTLGAILQDREFPDKVHKDALSIAMTGLNGVPQSERDALFRAAMKSGDVDDCALYTQALDIIEARHDAAAGAALIEENLRKSNTCLGTPPVRTLLAEAYLLEAAQAGPGPNKANAKLVQQALDALGGDLTPVAQRVAPRSFLTPVLPFLTGHVDHQALDGYGKTLICAGVIYLNPVLVKEELDSGANPNGRCEADSLVLAVLHQVTNEKVMERQQLLRLLLTRGARVEGIDYCSSPDDGDCYKVLLPILRDFNTRRSASAQSF